MAILNNYKLSFELLDANENFKLTIMICIYLILNKTYNSVTVCYCV